MAYKKKTKTKKNLLDDRVGLTAWRGGGRWLGENTLGIQRRRMALFSVFGGLVWCPRCVTSSLLHHRFPFSIQEKVVGVISERGACFVSNVIFCIFGHEFREFVCW
jgi:hypothetical protein